MRWKKLEDMTRREYTTTAVYAVIFGAFLGALIAVFKFMICDHG